MGVSGCGKTTLSKALATAFNYEFLEGDAFHSAENKKKMKNGIPLTDQDREPWLMSINQTLQKKQEKKRVLACSALKNKYRLLLSKQLPKQSVLWVYLHCEFSVLKKRMETRNHFMPVALLQSQLDALEPPKDAVVLNSSVPLEKMIQQLKPHLNEQ